MGLWGGLKSIGKGIGKGVKKAGKWVGEEVKKTFDPIVKGVKGDWKGALAGIGRNIKRGAQLGAVLGTGGVAGVGLGTLGAIGGGAEAALSGKGLKGTAMGALGGYGGVQTGKALGNIGRNGASRVGSGGAEALAGEGVSVAKDAAQIPATPPPIDVPEIVLSDPGAMTTAANVVGAEDVGNIGQSIWSRAGGYLSDNKADLAMKAAGQFMGGGQPAEDERYMFDDEPMMDPEELEALERQRLKEMLMMGGGSQYRPTSQYSSRWA